ncbi:MAG: hypothetical protein QM710_13845 [Flavobacterium sp.]
MSLSQRATEYLRSLKRDPDWVTKEEETTTFLRNLRISNFDNLLNTQLDYSGHELTVHNNEKFNYKINFISEYHIGKNRKIYTENVNGEIILDFENAKKACHYFITENGRICTKDEDNNRKIHYSYDRIENKNRTVCPFK